MRNAIAVILAALVFAGCAGIVSQPEQQSPLPSSPPTAFLLSQAAVPYTAHYAVSDGKESFTKTVWRSDNRARVDIEIAPGATVSLYFLMGVGYSCSNIGGKTACYEIRAQIEKENLGGIADTPDVTSGTELGSVDIGNTQGECYLLPYTVASKRKVCLTDRRVLAWDEYNVSQSQTHVEYLTSIDYSVDETVFTLPASPQVPPEN
ncbi:MAG: hypothetical protein NTV88_05465 [Candidatus Micrarchaeota archaeon]|nr:hypothetical protein [Candidatus Micrarchaeota archaeon]